MRSRAVASSSITSTQSPVGSRPPLVAAFAAASAPDGSRTVNTEPLPCSLVTATSPPITRKLARMMGGDVAEPGATVAPRGRGIGLSEFLEQLGLLLRRHADAGIGHRELDPVTTVGDPARLELDLALARELAGVAQKVEQDLPQPHGIGGQHA